jgi:hypothetical protein
LVFCILRYKDISYSHEDIKKLVWILKITSPFKYFPIFKIWTLVLSDKEEPEIFKFTQDFPPLKIREDFLKNIQVRLGEEYKLVILDAQGSVSCAELSQANRSSIIILGRRAYVNDDGFAKGFLHELGHAFGLRDECVNCQQRSSSGYPNCASCLEEAQKWWGDLVIEGGRVNYIYGCCGNEEYIRPTIASLMNDPDKADDFGPVNERYLRRELEALR